MKDQKKKDVLPPRFVSDLRIACGDGVHLPNDFTDDLKRVWDLEASGDISFGQLADLEIAIKRWSDTCTNELKQELARLPKRHPIKCPISLFGTMDFGRFEVAHTRTLAWLLNPNELHGFKKTMLLFLMRHLLKRRNLPEFNVVKVDAERFYRNIEVDDAGRTDIWVEGLWLVKPTVKPWLIVIEAKVDAPKDFEQLDRYEKEIDLWQAGHEDGNFDVFRVFLTPDGSRPNGAEERWQAISFSNLARLFCDAANFLTAQPGYHFLRYYLAGVLKDIVRLPIDGCDNDQNRYKLLGFLKELNAVHSRRTQT